MYFPNIMRELLRCEDFLDGEVPVCAIVAIENIVVAKKTNMVETLENPLFHAEFLAISEALKKLKSRYLRECSVYVSLEPCAFCAAALKKVRIKEIFFGAYDSKFGAIYHNSKIFDHSLHKPSEIIGGIMEKAFSLKLKNFFDKIRKRE